MDEEGRSLAASIGTTHCFAAVATRDLLLEEIDTLNRQLRRLERELNARAQQTAAVSQLRSIPGVGIRTAEAMAAFVDDPHRFAKAKFGLVPRQDQSGEKMLKQRGIDCVCRLTSHRKADCRRGKRLGPRRSCRQMAQTDKTSIGDRETYDAFPKFLMIGEVASNSRSQAFTMRPLIVATTLLDSVEFTSDALRQLYRARWNAELDLRSLKQTLEMDVLRCKTPEFVRKELWTHILAYNLICTITAQAATKYGIEPRAIGFKGAIQTLEAFQPVIAIQREANPVFRRMLYEHLLDAIAIHRVADRPDRYEPWQIKRRPKPYDRLMKPRWKAKCDLRNGFREN